jgi:hypothetical protein
MRRRILNKQFLAAFVVLASVLIRLSQSAHYPKLSSTINRRHFEFISTFKSIHINIFNRFERMTLILDEWKFLKFGKCLLFSLKTGIIPFNVQNTEDQGTQNNIL